MPIQLKNIGKLIKTKQINCQIMDKKTVRKVIDGLERVIIKSSRINTARIYLEL